jgi:hypothetical protein
MNGQVYHLLQLVRNYELDKNLVLPNEFSKYSSILKWQNRNLNDAIENSNPTAAMIAVRNLHKTFVSIARSELGSN